MDREEKIIDEILTVLKKHDLDILECKEMLNIIMQTFDEQLVENCTK